MENANFSVWRSISLSTFILQIHLEIHSLHQQVYLHLVIVVVIVNTIVKMIQEDIVEEILPVGTVAGLLDIHILVWGVRLSG